MTNVVAKLQEVEKELLATHAVKEQLRNSTNGHLPERKPMNGIITRLRELEKELLAEQKHSFERENKEEQAEKFQKVAKKRHSTSWKAIEKRQTEPKDNDSGQGEDHEEPDDQRKLSSPIKKTTGSHGVFYVCFPATALEQYVKKHAQVFLEVARSRKWNVYPFCWLNEVDAEHFCDDTTKITFVLEKSRSDPISMQIGVDAHSNSPRDQIPSQNSFNDCFNLYDQEEKWFNIEDPVWNRRLFSPEQDISPSLIENFLVDVHSGKLQEVKPFIREL